MTTRVLSVRLAASASPARRAGAANPTVNVAIPPLRKSLRETIAALLDELVVAAAEDEVDQAGKLDAELGVGTGPWSSGAGVEVKDEVAAHFVGHRRRAEQCEHPVD